MMSFIEELSLVSKPIDLNGKNCEINVSYNVKWKVGYVKTGNTIRTTSRSYEVRSEFEYTPLSRALPHCQLAQIEKICAQNR